MTAELYRTDSGPPEAAIIKHRNARVSQPTLIFTISRAGEGGRVGCRIETEVTGWIDDLCDPGNSYFISGEVTGWQPLPATQETKTIDRDEAEGLVGQHFIGFFSMRQHLGWKMMFQSKPADFDEAAREVTNNELINLLSGPVDPRAEPFIRLALAAMWHDDAIRHRSGADRLFGYGHHNQRQAS